MTQVATNRYQCISLPNSSEHHVEDKIAHRRANMWIVPGTYPGDPAFDQAGVMSNYARSHRSNYWLGQYPAQ